MQKKQIKQALSCVDTCSVVLNGIHTAVHLIRCLISQIWGLRQRKCGTI